MKTNLEGKKRELVAQIGLLLTKYPALLEKVKPTLKTASFSIIKDLQTNLSKRGSSGPSSEEANSAIQRTILLASKRSPRTMGDRRSSALRRSPEIEVSEV